MTTVRARLDRLQQRVQSWRPLRVWHRYFYARGNLLSAGIAFFGFFSLFPLLTLAAVFFGYFLSGRPELLAGVGETIEAMLPGLIKSSANPNGLIEFQPPDQSTLSATGIIAVVVLIFGGLGWISSLRGGIRAVLGAPGMPGTFVTARLRDLGMLLVLGLSVLASTVLTSAVGTAASWTAGLLGLERATWGVTTIALLVSVAVDTGIMVMALRFLSGVAIPWRLVWPASLLGGTAMAVITLAGAQLIALGTRNPLFGSVVVVVGVLFWLNLLAKVVLLAAGWAGIDLDPALVLVLPKSPVMAAALAEAPPTVLGGVLGRKSSMVPSTTAKPDTAQQPDTAQPKAAGFEAAGLEAAGLEAAGLEAADPRDRAVHGIPTFARRDEDRAALAAGAVLGATAALALSAARSGIRGLLGRR